VTHWLPPGIQTSGLRDFSLFLDRDGVINRRLPDEYVRNWGEFEFLPGTLDAIARFAAIFARVFVVTNQRGIGRGLMSEADLAEIHRRMLDAVHEHDGKIDRIYHCPHDLDAGCDCRKPAIGLALRARADFPGVDFSRAIMVGDSKSDMQFAARAGMKKVWIGTLGEAGDATPDASFPSLGELGRALPSAGG
jgi:D-glycero-D-manno-heptose 1,7-bisphosphate phosphatase